MEKKNDILTIAILAGVLIYAMHTLKTMTRPAVTPPILPPADGGDATATATTNAESGGTLNAGYTPPAMISMRPPKPFPAMLDSQLEKSNF